MIRGWLILWFASVVVLSSACFEALTQVEGQVQGFLIGCKAGDTVRYRIVRDTLDRYAGWDLTGCDSTWVVEGIPASVMSVAEVEGLLVP